MTSIYLIILESNSLNLIKLKIYNTDVLNNSIRTFYLEGMFSKHERKWKILVSFYVGEYAHTVSLNSWYIVLHTYVQKPI